MATIAYTTYNLSAFDADKAKAGSLVAMVKQSFANTTVSTSDIGDDFKGVGICVYASSNSLALTIDGDTFYFQENGYPGTSHSNNYMLKLATIEETVYTTGNAAMGTQAGSVTRGSTGSIVVGETTNTAQTVLIENLNARDKFAISALNSIIAKMGQDPATLSDAAVSHYCTQAFRYATYMMAASASARSTFKDQTTATGEADITALESNTDKLLNNLIVELKRTDLKETEGSTTTYFKNVKVDQMDDVTTAMAKTTTELEGLKTSVSGSLNNVSSALSDQKLYVKGIQDNMVLFKNCLTAVSTSTDSQTTSINNLVVAANTLIAKQEAIDATLSSISDAISNVAKALGNINTSLAYLSSMSSHLNNINSNVAALKTE